MKNRKLKMIFYLIRNILPISNYSAYRYQMDILKVLHAQTELMMLNRSDIHLLSKGMAMSHKCDKLCKSKTDEFKGMYE